MRQYPVYLPVTDRRHFLHLVNLDFDLKFLQVRNQSFEQLALFLIVDVEELNLLLDGPLVDLRSIG